LARHGLHERRNLRRLEVRRDAEEARVERRPARGVQPVAEALALLHALQEPRALALAEHEREEVEERGVRMREGNGRPAQLEARALERSPQERAADALLRRL